MAWECPRELYAGSEDVFCEEEDGVERVGLGSAEGNGEVGWGGMEFAVDGRVEKRKRRTCMNVCAAEAMKMAPGLGRIRYG
jgi:hypothetical protein